MFKRQLNRTISVISPLGKWKPHSVSGVNYTAVGLTPPLSVLDEAHVTTRLARHDVSTMLFTAIPDRSSDVAY